MKFTILSINNTEVCLNSKYLNMCLNAIKKNKIENYVILLILCTW